MCVLIFEFLRDIEFRIIGRHHNLWKPFAWLYLVAMGVERAGSANIGNNLFIRYPGCLRLGHRCSLGGFTRIWNYALVTIGDDFLSAGNLTINSGGHDPVTLIPIVKPITIGHRVWCGVNVMILAGVTIGNDVIIAAGSVVISDVPSGSLVAGVPAVVKKKLNRTSDEIWSPFTR